MIEDPTNFAAPAASPQDGALPDQTLEAVALAGASAIQRLIAERNTYCNRMSDQQRDLLVLRAINEDIRHRIVLIRQRYVGASKNILAQLEQLDKTTF